MKLCIKCNKNPRDENRRYCRRCYLDRRKEVYWNGGKEKKIRYGKVKCTLCKNDIIKSRRNQELCIECSRKIRSVNLSINQYKFINKNERVHRVIAEEILNRRLKKNETVHHIDFNKENNIKSNLLVMTHNGHSSLHFFIKKEVHLSKIKKTDRFFKKFIIKQTKIWISITKNKVIYLSKQI